MVKDFPDMKFTLCHCGAEALGPVAAGYIEWRSLVSEIAENPNVVCKIGGHEMFAPNNEFEIVRHCLESFGWDRC